MSCDVNPIVTTNYLLPHPLPRQTETLALGWWYFGEIKEKGLHFICVWI